MAEQSQPRVNPSDWANRRKHAMNRARELRSRMKEVDLNQGSSDVSSLASKSEIQRQRRSRQLEATQRLLDGQVGGFSLTESSSGRSVGSKGMPFGGEGRGQKSTSDNMFESGSRRSAPRYNHDEQPVGRSGSHTRHEGGSETHSIISQQHLGRIHKRYHKPIENDLLKSKLEQNARLTRYNSEIEDRVNESKGAGAINEFRLPSDAAPDHTSQQTLREKPPEGRGRGRGRRKSPPGPSSLGELSGSRKSLSHASTIVKDQMVDARSRSPSITRINSPSSHPSQYRKANVDASESLSLQSYLRSRQVPDYKEGECEKLAILRERLVARRRKRHHRVQNGKENENTQPEPSKGAIKSSKSQYGHGGHCADIRVNSGPEDMTPSLERLDPNDFSAQDFQSKPKKTNDSYHDVMASPPRIQSHELDERHHRHHESNSMDRSQNSYTQSERVEGNDDDASVVDIKLIQCDSCKRSFAPKVYEKHFDSDGQPKCAVSVDKKRPVFNSAKARIANNTNLNSDEQMQVLQVNKKVTKELARKLQGKGSKKRSKRGGKWKEESMNFREAMRANRLISKAEKEGKPAHYYL